MLAHDRPAAHSLTAHLLAQALPSPDYSRTDGDHYLTDTPQAHIDRISRGAVSDLLMIADALDLVGRCIATEGAQGAQAARAGDVIQFLAELAAEVGRLGETAAMLKGTTPES